MATDASSPTDPLLAKPARHWKIPATTALVAAIALGVAWFWPDLQGATRSIITAVSLLVAGIVLAVWAVFLAGFQKKARWLLGGGLIAAFVLVIGSFRITGYDGDLVPILSFRWTLRDVAVEIEGGRVNLTATDRVDFTQFQGANRNGEIQGVTLARDWEAAPPKLLWKTPIGLGFSAFVIVGDVAITQQQEGEDELVVCYDLHRGDVLWKHTDATRYAPVGGRGFGGIGPRATVTVDNGKIYSMGATGILNCLSAVDGAFLWSRNVVKENQAQLPDWGVSCSPLIVDDMVVVTAGHDIVGNKREMPFHTLVAFDKESGDLRWTAGADNASYSSPALATIAGMRQIVSVNANTVSSHDPVSGQVLWQHDWPPTESSMPNVAQPVPLPDDHLFVSKGYGYGSTLWKIEGTASGNLDVKKIWYRSDLMKTKFTNVVVRGEYLYGLSEKILECISWRDEKRQWRHRGDFGHGQILLVDDLMLILTESGELVLVEVNPAEYIETSRIQPLSGRTWNPPALAGRYLLLRNDREVACYELPGRIHTTMAAKE